MNDDDRPKRHDLTTSPTSWRQTLWHKPLSEWWAAAAFLLEATLQLAAQTAALLLAATLVIYQTLAWRGYRKELRR